MTTAEEISRYYSIEKADRMSALTEGYRVLRPGGILLAFGISSYASTIVGIVRDWTRDPEYLRMCEKEIRTGRHDKPDTWPNLFQTAYFHHPDTLVKELEEAGFNCEGVLGVQGPGWMTPDFAESWDDPTRREAILHVARLTEHDPVLSPHIMAAGRKGEDL